MSDSWEIDNNTNEWAVDEEWAVDNEDKGGMGKAFGSGVDKVQELGYRAIKGFTDSGNEGDGLIEKDGPLANFAQQGIDRNIEEQKAYSPTVGSYKDVDSVGDALSYTGELVAGSLPYMAAAMTGAGAVGMAGGLSQEAYEAHRLAFGEIGKSIMKDGFINTAKKMSKGDLVKLAKEPGTALAFSKRVMLGAAGEGVTESMQEALAMWGAGQDFGEFKMLNHNKNSDDILGSDGQRLMESFVGGVVVGGVIRTGSEGAQKLMSWQEKSAPIAKNGIDELVKQGVPQGEAIDQVRAQLITSAMKQGLTEVEAAAAAARTMKAEYDIDHEIFTPIANDVASRREALSNHMHKETLEGGFGRVQDSLNGERAPTSDELVQQQMQANAPEFFDQLNAQEEVKAQEVNKVTKPEENLPLTENDSVSEKDLPGEPPQKGKITGLNVVEAPVNELSLSNDVPQFKDGANDQGVVEPLGGKFERTGVAPVQVWVRSNGDKEVISGRHRLDLAKRSGEQTIPAQYHYEEDGFNTDKAAILDSLLNIREGQGKVKDYVEFIKATKPTEAEANADGILARQTGKRAYAIATQGSDELIAAHRANRVSDEAATRIAKAAPGNEALQLVGVKAIDEGKTIAVAENMVKAVGSMTDGADQQSGDLFGFDDSALIEAESLAKAASKKQSEIQRSLSAIQGAAKRPELAAKEGVNVKDPKAVNQRIEQLKDEKRQWDNWHTNPELVNQLKAPIPATTTDTTDAQKVGTGGTGTEKAQPIPPIPPIPKQEKTTEPAASQEAVVVSEPELAPQGVGLVKVVVDGDNKLLTGNDLDLAAKTINKIIESISRSTNEVEGASKLERVMVKLNQRKIGMSNGIGTNALNTFVQARLDGTTNITFAQWFEGRKGKPIDEAAHEAATSPTNDLAEPSQAQKEAGNYKLGRIKHSGFDIGIENPEGSNRTGVDPNGKEWSVKMTAHYGDLTGTIAADGDALSLSTLLDA